MQNDTLITVKWARLKPEVEFQQGGRLYFEIVSTYISAANGGIISTVGAPIWAKFGSLMQNNLLITPNW